MLTVYGIETNFQYIFFSHFYILLLQQCLPFTVLKLFFLKSDFISVELQQCLPFTVLKLIITEGCNSIGVLTVATVLTVYGIETIDVQMLSTLR